MINDKTQQEPTPITRAVDALNAAWEADPAALWALFCIRIPCNDALAAHPTVQVDGYMGQFTPNVGVLGLINGVIESATGEKIAIMWTVPNEDGVRRIIGFDVYGDASDGGGQ